MTEFIAKYWLEFLFGLIIAVLSALYASLKRKIKAQVGKDKALKAGMCALLRAELIRSGERYIQQEYCEIYAKDSYDKAYIAYNELGGNGSLTELHDRVMDLQTTVPNKK